MNWPLCHLSCKSHVRLAPIFLGVALCLSSVSMGFAQTADDPRLLTCVAFGDSTTAPREVGGHPLEVYSTLVERRLTGEGVIPRVINKGVPGNTTADALKRLSRDVLALHPDIVLLQFGINDSAVDVWRTPPAVSPSVPLAEYEANLREMVRQLRNAGVEVVLMTPNPVRWTPELRKLYSSPPYKPSDPDGWNVLLADYAACVRRVATSEKVKLVDIYTAFQAYGKQPGHSIDELLLDGMHPNDNGHRLVADLIIETLNTP